MVVLPRLLVLDTCVLLSNVVRRLVLNMARRGCFQPLWSPVIREEWQRNAARIWRVSTEQTAHQWALLEKDFPQANMGETEAFKEGLRYSDAKDWHVIATARAAGAWHEQRPLAIVTYNTRDFRRSELRRFGVDLLDPDQLLLALWASQRVWLIDELQDLAGLADEDAALKGQAFVSMLLKRERLFRFNKQYQAWLDGET